MTEQKSELMAYLNSLLHDTHIKAEIPATLRDVEGLTKLDTALRALRKHINELSEGNLSDLIAGTGYTIGVVKKLQATLKSMAWQMEATSTGDFTHRVQFLGEFSRAFNSMSASLENAFAHEKEAKALFELFFETVPDAVIICSIVDQKIYNCNRAFEQMSGMEKNQLLGEIIGTIPFFKNCSQPELFKKVFFESGPIRNVRIKLGVEQTILCLLSSERIKIDAQDYILCVIKDVTELQRLQEQMEANEAFYRLLAENASDVIFTMNLDGKFTYISPSVEKLRGYTPEEVMQQPMQEVICPDSMIHFEQGLIKSNLAVKNHQPIEPFHGYIQQPCKDGSTVWIDLTVTGLYSMEGETLGFLGVARNATQRKKLEEEIIKLSETDTLTQLYNRRKMESLFNTEVARVQRSQSVCSVVLFDIDDFKKINDTHGHQAGDIVLKDIARIVRNTTRTVDLAGRWGGEEFLLILPFTDMKGAGVLAETLRQAIAKHRFETIGNEVTASFGVATTHGDLDASSLIVSADKAMYQAKRSGKNQVVLSGKLNPDKA